MPNLKDILAKQNKDSTVVNKQEFKTQLIHINNLTLSEDNFYSTNEIEDFADMLALAGEVKQNLLVKKVEANKYEVIAGHKRLLGARINHDRGIEGFEFLPCKVEITDDLMTEFNLITTNSTQRVRSDFEKVKEAQRLKEIIPKLLGDENIKGRALRKLVAESMGTSETTVANYNNINNNLSEIGKERMAAGELSVSVANELAGLKEEMQEAVLANNTEITVKDIKNIKAAEQELALDETNAIFNIAKREDVIDIIKYADGQRARIDGLKNIYNGSGAMNGILSYNFNNKGLTFKVEAYDEKTITWNRFEEMITNAVKAKEIVSTLKENELSACEKAAVIDCFKRVIHYGSLFIDKTPELLMTYRALVDDKDRVNLLKEYTTRENVHCVSYYRNQKSEFYPTKNIIKFYEDCYGECTKQINYEEFKELFDEVVDKGWLELKNVSEHDISKDTQSLVNTSGKDVLENYECDNQMSIEEIEPQLVLKNNTERKEWLKNWKSWSLWFEIAELKARYYRYVFPDESYIVAVVYEKSPSYKWLKEDDYSHPYYHLVKKGENYHGEQTTAEYYIIEHLKQVVPRK